MIVCATWKTYTGMEWIGAKINLILNIGAYMSPGRVAVGIIGAASYACADFTGSSEAIGRFGGTIGVIIAVSSQDETIGFLATVFGAWTGP